MLARKRVYEMCQEMQQTSKLLNNAKDDASREEAERAVCSSLKKLGLALYLPLTVTPYTLITLHITISNMVDNVPSLKGGGAFWFTDLTAPDALCIFPMITSLFIMLTSELKYSATKKCEKCSCTLHKEAQRSKGSSESDISSIYAVDSNPSSGDFLFLGHLEFSKSCRKDSQLCRKYCMVRH